jgi:hypothetical protein
MHSNTCKKPNPKSGLKNIMPRCSQGVYNESRAAGDQGECSFDSTSAQDRSQHCESRMR